MKPQPYVCPLCRDGENYFGRLVFEEEQERLLQLVELKIISLELVTPEGAVLTKVAPPACVNHKDEIVLLVPVASLG